MKIAHVLAAALAASAAACQPPAANTPPQTNGVEALSPDASRQGVLSGLTPVLTADIGQALSLDVTTLNIDDDWAFAVVQPKAAAGGAIDWSKTKYAERAADGVLDGNGTTYALLQNINGAWTVRDFAVGPTDVVYLDWAMRYGAPATLFASQ